MSTFTECTLSNNPYAEGTAAELVSHGLTINGAKVDQVGISVLSRYGIIKVMGLVPKVEGRKGKQASIYRVEKSVNIDFQFSN